MKRFLLAATCSILILFVQQSNYAQTHSITKRIGSVVLGGKNKSESVKSFAELPAAITEKATKHLIERLGADFYNKLHFSYGVVVDYLEFCDSDDCNQESQAITYKLGYAFSLPKIGIKLYEAQIWLNKTGEVIKEIDLPAIKQNPEKAGFISVKEAINIGNQNNFKTGYVKLAYRQKDDSIVWQLINESNAVSRQLEISAHNGKILNEVGYRGIR